MTGSPQTFRTMEEIFTDILNDPAVAAIGMALGLAAVALWLVAAWWAYNDAAHRTESSIAAFLAAGWVVLSTPLMLPLSLLIYGFARPQLTAADHRATHLVRELVSNAPPAPACTGCGAAVDDSWLRCPTCATWLATPCSACGSWSDPVLEICPWCGSDDRSEAEVPVLAPQAGRGFAHGRRARVAWRSSAQGGPSVRPQPNRRLPVSPDGRLLTPTKLRV